MIIITIVSGIATGVLLASIVAIVILIKDSIQKKD
jgi:hypothetical protein